MSSLGHSTRGITTESTGYLYRDFSLAETQSYVSETRTKDVETGYLKVQWDSFQEESVAIRSGARMRVSHFHSGGSLHATLVSKTAPLEDFRILRDGTCTSHRRCKGRGKLALSPGGGATCVCSAQFAGAECERCAHGYAGADCSQSTCPDFCSHHGVCSPDGHCVCDEGYHGRACEQALCAGDCSGHGFCAAVVALSLITI